jgi:hypothetical protein
MIGQTAAIYFALVPLVYDKTGIPFNITIGWLVRNGKSIVSMMNASFSVSSKGILTPG